MKKIIIAGGAGLVGKSLLKVINSDKYEITVIDKDLELINSLKKKFTNVLFINIDLSEINQINKYNFTADILILLQAQIKGLAYEVFHKNTVQSTTNLINYFSQKKIKPYIVHISSSVVNSKANDFYTKSKIEQETLVKKTDYKKVILRPTLMYGDGDNKHLFVLLNLMRRLKMLPLPGNGKFFRQPLFAIDFAHVIYDCIKHEHVGSFNISGLEKIYFRDCLLKLKKSHDVSAVFIPIPIFIFRYLLRFISFFYKNVPFTEQQLNALIIDELFEMNDWPKKFDCKYTKFDEALTKFKYEF